VVKLKLTKNELKTQKEALARFRRYLPMLILKKQQLQFEIGKIERAITDVRMKIRELEQSVAPWVAVFGEDVGLSKLLEADHIEVEAGNVAGVNIPIFRGLSFREEEYDLLLTPLWVDRAIEVCKEALTLKAQLIVYETQREFLGQELRITTQRVNLFEKVKIPQAQENIRIINIYLGDLQTAEVVRGKIAKAKIEKKREALKL